MKWSGRFIDLPISINKYSHPIYSWIHWEDILLLSSLYKQTLLWLYAFLPSSASTKDSGVRSGSGGGGDTEHPVWMYHIGKNRSTR